MAYLYRHIRLDNNELFYIGVGKEDDGKYKRAHCCKRRNKFWKRIISKTDYKVEIMLDDLTYEEAREKEIEFIALYGRRDCGKGTLCNLTDGADGSLGVIQGVETRIKKSKASSGKNNPNYGGKFHNKEYFEKQVKSNSDSLIKVFDTQTEEVTYLYSEPQVAKFLGVSRSMVNGGLKKGWKPKRRYVLSRIDFDINLEPLFINLA